jgi:AbrB family looped-hinge helix DNA binding protein
MRPMRPSSYMENVWIQKVSRDGRVVIPAELRRRLRLKRGTRLAVRMSGTELTLQPITDKYIDSVRGMLGDTTTMIESLRRDHRKEG